MNSAQPRRQLGSHVGKASASTCLKSAGGGPSDRYKPSGVVRYLTSESDAILVDKCTSFSNLRLSANLSSAYGHVHTKSEIRNCVIGFIYTAENGPLILSPIFHIALFLPT